MHRLSLAETEAGGGAGARRKFKGTHEEMEVRPEFLIALWISFVDEEGSLG